jgi:S1-C subfamily serine protease
MVSILGHGRGFIVEAGCARYVATAGHCLPKLPPAASFTGAGEKTYAVFGYRDGNEAECVFADPVSDLAILGAPDSQEFPEAAELWERVVMGERRTVLAIGDVADGDPVYIPAKWSNDRTHRATARVIGRALWIECPTSVLKGGMSGSPILSADGRAVGVFTTSSRPGRMHGPQPWLRKNLPGWMLQ